MEPLKTFFFDENQDAKQLQVLFDAAKRIVEVDNGISALDSLLRLDKPDDDKWTEVRYNTTSAWNQALKKFDETKMLIAVVCDNDTIMEFENLAVFIHQIGAKLVYKDAKIFQELGKELAMRLLRARAAIRKELGIDVTLQSIEQAKIPRV